MPIKGILGGAGVKPLGYGLGVEAEEKDPNFNQTVLLLHADGSEGAGDTSNLGSPNYKAFRDNSTSAHAITVNGDAYGNDFSPYYYADGYWSNNFDGTTDYLQVASSSDFVLGTNNFTIEFWVYFFDNATSSFYCIENNGALFYYDGTRFVLGKRGSATIYLTYTVTPTLSTWHHVALCRDGTGTDETCLFYNGTRVAQATVSNNFSNQNVLQIGNISGLSGYDLNGYLSNYRVVNGSSVYSTSSSSITVPTAPLTAVTNTKLLTCQSNRFVDNSSTGHTISPNGTPKVSTNTPFTQSKTANVGSGFFDGTDDYLNATLSSAIGTGDMTVEFWYYPTVFANYLAPFAVNASGDRNQGFNVGSDENGKLKFVDTDATNYESGNNQLQLHSWNHIATVRDGSTVRIFHNGTQIGTVSNSENWTGTIIAVGARADDFSEEITGYIADCNLVVGTAKYDASGYTVPTSTTSADANTKFLTCQYSGAVRNVGFVDDSKYNHQITRNGDVSLGTFSPFSLEDGYWSVYFDGSDDELNLTNTATIGTGNFTMEMWVFPHNRSNSCLIDSRSANGATDGIIFKLNSNKFQISGIDGTTDIPLNEWTHLAVVREGTGANQTKMYINGALEKTITFALDLTSTFFGVGVFNDGGNSGDYKGYISNLRVVNDTVYTDAFTVSSEPLTAISNTDVLICQSNRFIDNSTNGFAITLPQGTAKVLPFSPFAPTRPYTKDAVGGSAFFDGTGDSLKIEPQNDKDVFNPTTTYTVEGWLYVNIDSPGTRHFLTKGGTGAGWGAATGHYFIMFYYSGSVYVQIKKGTSSLFGISAAHGPSYQWNHFAVGYDGSTTRFWWNGQSLGSSGDTPVADTATNGDQMYLGVSNDGSTGHWPGYISNVRYVRGTDIYGVDNTSITVPTSPPTAVTNTNFLTTFTNAGIIDHTMRNNLETEGNTRISGQQVKFGTGSIYFDGTGDALRLPYSPALAMDAGNWTIEFFMYYDQSSFSGYRTIIDQRNSSDSETSIVIYFDAGNSLDFYTAGAMRADIDISSLSVRTWHHVALVKNGSTTKFYLDGTATGTSDSSDSRTYLANGDTHIGERYNSAQYFLGYLDEFRITKGVARYTSDFTAPTKAFANE